MLEFGYIKLYRSILNWEWYDDIKTKTLFLHLLLTVNYYDAGWHGLTIKKGQRMCSIATLSLETKLTVQEVRTAVKRLKSTGEITCETSRGCTLITIKNFERYQQDKSMPADKQQSEGTFPTDEQHASNKALTSEQQAANTAITSNQHTSNTAATIEQQQSKKARKQELNIININSDPELSPKRGGAIPIDEKGKPAGSAEQLPKYTPDFEKFWNEYPRKVDKGDAFKKYKARLKDGYTPEQLETAAKNYARQCLTERTDRKYIKHPKTFLSDTMPFLDYLRQDPSVVAPPDATPDANPFAKYKRGKPNE